VAVAEPGRQLVAVVPMRARHLRGVVAIEQQTSQRPWSKDLFASELKQVSSRAFVAVRSDATVLGFGCLMSTGFEAHVTNIAVDPLSRRGGLATKLMLRLIAESQDWGLDSLTLEVRASNVAAQELYRRFGFAPGGIRPKYYAESAEDAIIMWVHDIDSEAYRRRIDAIVADLGGGTVGP